MTTLHKVTQQNIDDMGVWIYSTRQAIWDDFMTLKNEIDAMVRDGWDDQQALDFYAQFNLVWMAVVGAFDSAGPFPKLEIFLSDLGVSVRNYGVQFPVIPLSSIY